jgi:hypothetical protein
LRDMPHNTPTLNQRSKSHMCTTTKANKRHQRFFSELQLDQLSET